MGQPHHGDILRHKCRAVCLGPAFVHRVHRQAHIARHRQPRHQRIGLKHQPPLRPRPGNGRALESNGAFFRRGQTRHQIDQRGFPRARKPKDRQKLALRHIKGQRFQHFGPCVTRTKPHGNIVKFKNTHVDHRFVEKVKSDCSANITRSSRKPMMPMVSTATMMRARLCCDPF